MADKKNNEDHKEVLGSNVEETLKLEDILNDEKDKNLRLLAEIDNMKKRHVNEIAQIKNYAITDLIRNLSTSLDHAFMALDSTDIKALAEDNALKILHDGIRMTIDEMIKTLSEYGLKRLVPIGEKFDYSLHEAVSKIEDPNIEHNKIVNVVQAGYMIKERVIRPAKVVVNINEQKIKKDSDSES